MRCNYACPLTAGPECPHTKDGADHVPLIFLSGVICMVCDRVTENLFVLQFIGR